MLDMVLPQDVYRLALPISREEREQEVQEQEQQQQEEQGVMATMTNLALSPLHFIVFLIENWVEGTLKQSLYHAFVKRFA